jgi:hypothetical protein
MMQKPMASTHMRRVKTFSVLSSWVRSIPAARRTSASESVSVGRESGIKWFPMFFFVLQREEKMGHCKLTAIIRLKRRLLEVFLFLIDVNILHLRHGVDTGGSNLRDWRKRKKERKKG